MRLNKNFEIRVELFRPVWDQLQKKKISYSTLPPAVFIRFYPRLGRDLQKAISFGLAPTPSSHLSQSTITLFLSPAVFVRTVSDLISKQHLSCWHFKSGCLELYFRWLIAGSVCNFFLLRSFPPSLQK